MCTIRISIYFAKVYLYVQQLISFVLHIDQHTACIWIVRGVFIQQQEEKSTVLLRCVVDKSNRGVVRGDTCTEQH